MKNKKLELLFELDSEEVLDFRAILDGFHNWYSSLNDFYKKENETCKLLADKIEKVLKNN